MSKMDELKWIRVFTPIHIPPYLVEQIKKRDYSVSDFYKFQEKVCLRHTKEGPTLNPFSHLYILSTEDYVCKGFLWFTVDPLSKDILIQTYSVDKEYWKSGIAVKKVCDLIKEVHRKSDLNKIYWITDYPKHSEKHGFKRSKSILMEYHEDDEKKTEEKDAKKVSDEKDKDDTLN